MLQIETDKREDLAKALLANDIVQVIDKKNPAEIKKKTYLNFDGTVFILNDRFWEKIKWNLLP